MATLSYDEIRRTVRASCERMGVDEVRKQLATANSIGIRRKIMQEWLRDTEPLHRDAQEAIERARDREVGREANRIAERALTRSGIANAIAVCALVVAVAAIVVE